MRGLGDADTYSRVPTAEDMLQTSDEHRSTRSPIAEANQAAARMVRALDLHNDVIRQLTSPDSLVSARLIEDEISSPEGPARGGSQSIWMNAEDAVLLWESQSNASRDSYSEILRRELRRQTDEIQGTMVSLADDTIRTLRAECATLQTLNAELADRLANIEQKTEAISAELASANKMNDSMKELLSTKYQTRTLFTAASILALTSAGSLVLYSTRHIAIIHPMLATIVLVASLGFAALAVTRARPDESPGP
jgi:hypothetical protein